ncbi:MAG: hypothetical protein H0W83_13110 [Planctomycetes bacterium]|nr:hypothetical protein [Planctomycetota bacterium]
MLLAAIEDHGTRVAASIERRVLAGLAGGCSLPLGCLVRRIDGRWTAVAFLGHEAAAGIDCRETGPAASLAQQVLARLVVGGFAPKPPRPLSPLHPG